jgi:hypothetical protein
MRLFYDEYTSTKRGDLLLLFADCIAILAAVLFATGAPFHAHESLWDVALLGIWAVIPRNIAKFLEWVGRPRDFVLSFSLSIAFVAFVTLLLVAGWEILDLTMANDQPMLAGTKILILVLWGSGYLLCHARSYRLHDFLLAAVILLGLLQRMPFPYLWLPFCFVGMSLSAACRHLLHDVFPGVRAAPLNLQNARSLALTFTLVAVGLFAVVYQGLYPLLDAGVEEQARRTGRGTNWFSWGRRDGKPGERGGAQSGGPGAGRSRHDPGDDILPDDSESGDGLRQRRIGFTHSVRLQDLAAPRFDPRKVFIVRKEAPNGETPSNGEWQPDGYTLWRVMAFSYFDAATATWLEDTEYTQGEWNRDGRYRLSGENTARWIADVDPVWLRIDVVAPVFRNLVAPYAPIELGPVRAKNGSSKGFFLRNAFGDIVPYPALDAGSTYYAKVRPSPGGLFLPPEGNSREHPAPRYLDLPATESTRVDLKALAKTIFRDCFTVHDKVRALTVHYANSFKRSNVTTWRGDHDHLRRFLVDERTGDCTYFSTASALLLRAAGVSTRLVVGFVGGEAESDGTFSVRNMNAHGWLEVYMSTHGWIPFDPTVWARPASDDPGAGANPGAPNDAFQLGGAPDTRDIADGRQPRTNFPPNGGDSRAPGVDNRGQPLAPFEDDTSPRNSNAPPPPQTSRDYGGISGIFGDGFFGGRGDPGVGRRDGAERSSDDSPDTSKSEEPKGSSRFMRSAIVRAVLVCLGGGALILAVIAYLRPRRKKEEDEDENDDKEKGVQPLGLHDDPLIDWQPADEREAVLHEYHRMQVDLARTRSHRRAHQTPLEHGARFKGREEELDRAFGLLHRILYAILYGRGRASSGDVADARRQCRTIRKHLT